MADCDQQRLLQDILLQLGQMAGRLSSIDRRQSEQTQWLEGIDRRLQATERRVFTLWLVSGAVWAALLVGFGVGLKMVLGTG